MRLSKLLLLAAELFAALVSQSMGADLVGDYSKIKSLNFATDYADHGNPTAVGLAIVQTQQYLLTGKDPGPLSPWFVLAREGDKNPRDQIDKYHGASSSRLIWQWSTSIASCELAACPFGSRLTPAMETASQKYRIPIGLKGIEAVPNSDAAFDYLATHKGDAVYVGSEGWQAYAWLGIDEPTGKVISLTFFKELREPVIKKLTPANPSVGQITLLDRKAGADLWQRQLHGQRNMGVEANYVVVYTLPGN